MTAAPARLGECRRLQALRSYAVLDTLPEEALDDLTALAAHLCAAPVALISLIDEDRQWFKSRVGTELAETALDLSFCVYALGQPGLFVVPDASRDSRFAHNPLVTGEPGICFYAGAPLITPDGEALGTLCVIDYVPRTLTGVQEQALRVLSRQVMTHLELRRQRRELQASESKLRAIFEAEPECVKLLGTDGTLREVNAAGLQIIEAASLEAVPHRNFLPLVVPQDRAAVLAMLAAAARGEKRIVSFQLIGLAGTARSIEMTGVPFSDEASGEALVLGISLDVTTRKLAEFRLHRLIRLHTVLSKTGKAILRSDERLELYDAVCRIAVEDGRLRMAMVVEVDPATGRVRAVASQGEGRDYARVVAITTDDGALGQGTIGTTLRTGRADFCNDFASEPRMAPWRESALEHGFRAVAAFPLQRGESTIGALVLFTGETNYFREDELRLMRSVADNLSFGLAAQEKEQRRRQAEGALRASESQFASAFEYAAIGMALVAPDGRFLKVNRALERMLGFSSAELLACSFQDITHPDDLPADLENVERLLAGASDTYQIEKRYLPKHGEVVSAILSVSLVRDGSGQPLHFIAQVQDVTERKQLELQFLRAQRMESIGTLAGGIAHDLNNSLAPIMMSLELLAARFPDPDSAELLEIVGASARRGSAMVRQVLSFARGVEGERQEVQLRHLIREVEKIVTDTFAKNLQVTTRVASDLWTVLGDSTQLHQMLLNLCVNARDAMPNRGTLTIAAENLVLDAHYAGLSWNHEAKPGPHVFLQVVDTGTGISPAVMEKIFDPFFTTKELSKGTGLGLSTSLAIVKSHGGFIRVYSELGKGTKFEVYLPALPEPGAPGAADSPADLPRGHGELILVVDDELAVRQITDHTLKAFGYRVVLAGDGAEAVAIYARERDEIAAVLTDMMMPVMDGPATIQILRRINPKLPIIAASGHSSEDLVASLGVEHFLAKPYSAEPLLKVLRAVLAGRR